MSSPRRNSPLLFRFPTRIQQTSAISLSRSEPMCRRPLSQSRDFLGHQNQTWNTSSRGAQGLVRPRFRPKPKSRDSSPRLARGDRGIQAKVIRCKATYIGSAAPPHNSGFRLIPITIALLQTRQPLNAAFAVKLSQKTSQLSIVTISLNCAESITIQNALHSNQFDEEEVRDRVVQLKPNVLSCVSSDESLYGSLFIVRADEMITKRFILNEHGDLIIYRLSSQCGSSGRLVARQGNGQIRRHVNDEYRPVTNLMVSPVGSYSHDNGFTQPYFCMTFVNRRYSPSDGRSLYCMNDIDQAMSQLVDECTLLLLSYTGTGYLAANIRGSQTHGLSRYRGRYGDTVPTLGVPAPEAIQSRYKVDTAAQNPGTSCSKGHLF
ncbi:hypothetical protein K440DRAFT_658800 [Wilcoxina mikolae CBS 423.85]|nr:hypothetical protein K440DRAFT_658800 [Wilcoxina mikolae CBS 423.85]